MRLDQSSVDISTLVEKIGRGEIDLQPEFQRGQVWPDLKKKRLIDTLLREWYVPAIHIVVNDELDKEEILDGQQRLRTIIEFMNDEFSVDGFIEPEDSQIKQYDGLSYSQLPDRTRSKFRRFTINTVRLRHYKTEEPGELFFRLNQLTALTAAEQRNALIGEPRNQIRLLSEYLDRHLGEYRIGFSNARMNYDDVLSRLAVTLEAGKLETKITATTLERRYRKGSGFTQDNIDLISISIEKLSIIVNEYPGYIRLNKASLFSWLFFLADRRVGGELDDYTISKFFIEFESLRQAQTKFDWVEREIESENRKILQDLKSWKECISIFNDRSSSRVNDVTSVILRDLCLNIGVFLVYEENSERRLRKRLYRTLEEARILLEMLPDDVSERSIAEHNLARFWELNREAL